MDQPEQRSMSDKIVYAIDSLIAIMNQTADLRADVLPFISPTFNQIKRLAHANGDTDNSYELFRIATSDLPRTIDFYCALPIEMRNTKAIKDGRTARQLLVKDLNLIRTQIQQIENNMYADMEKAVRANSSVLEQNFTGEMSLLKELENDPQGGFVDQFELDQYMKSGEYLQGFSKKQNVQENPEVLALRLQQQKEKTDQIAQRKLKRKMLLQKMSYKMSAVAQTIGDYKWRGGFSGMGLFLAIFAISGIHGCAQNSNYQDIARTQLPVIYDIVQSNNLSAEQVVALAKNQTNIMVDGSNYRISKLSITPENNNQVIHVGLKQISSSNCEAMVDVKENLYAGAIMKINGISLPEQHLYSDRYMEENSNHKLCYLNNNTIDVLFNTPEIRQQEIALENSSPDKLKSMIQANKSAQKALEEYSRHSRDEAYRVSADIYNTIEQRNIKLKKFLAQKEPESVVIEKNAN